MSTAIERSPRVILVGPPNAGKTTLYNWLTGSRYRTVNYPGATVEFAVGKSLEVYGPQVEALDTPGLYSLLPKSPEEKVTVDALFAESNLAVIVAVVDATQLARHLPLVAQLKESGFPVVLAITMNDLLKQRGGSLDAKKLSIELGMSVAVIDGRLGGGVKELMDTVQGYTASSPSGFSKLNWDLGQIKAGLERARDINSKVVSMDRSKKESSDDLDRTSNLDRWLLHPIMGLVFFFFIMSAVFTSIFWAAQPLMELVDGFFGYFADQIWNLAPGSLWAGFLSKGLISGIGSVLIFVPQIFILFLGLGFLEDWGYLARAAALVDRPLSKLGLNGRSFVPMLSGFACAIPAMMAARTIANRKERLLTIFILPLMSCSARLPVYALLLTFILGTQSALLGGMVLTAIYALSLIVGAIAAVIAGRFIRFEEKSWFMLELPVYRAPRIKTVVTSSFRRTLSYIQRAGPMILGIALAIWVGTTFPDYSNMDEAQRLQNSYIATAGKVLEPVMAPMGGDWRVGVGLISAFAAREVFVSAMALVFNLSEIEDDSLQDTLLKSMREATHADGTPLFTVSSVAGLIIFFMIALQCLTTVAVARRESGSLKFAIAQLVIFTLVGYAAAVLVNQGLRQFLN